MDEGHIIVDSIKSIRLADITSNLARESGFKSVKDLLETAKHGSGKNVYLIRFRYLRPGAWDTRAASESTSPKRSELLRRIHDTVAPRSRTKPRVR